MLSVVDARKESGTDEMLRVFRILGRIDNILAQLANDDVDVALFRRQVPGWVRIPLGLQGGWSSAAAAETFLPQAVIDQVEGLALFLDGKVYEFDGSRQSDLRDLLGDVRDALEVDDALPQPLKVYLHHLLSEMQRALDDDAIGVSFDFADAVRRLWVALGSAENATDEQSKPMWRRFAERILFDSTAQAMVIGGQAAITLAIEAGN